jgi:hypothetical protein
MQVTPRRAEGKYEEGGDDIESVTTAVMVEWDSPVTTPWSNPVGGVERLDFNDSPMSAPPAICAVAPEPVPATPEPPTPEPSSPWSTTATDGQEEMMDQDRTMKFELSTKSPATRLLEHRMDCEQGRCIGSEPTTEQENYLLFYYIQQEFFLQRQRLEPLIESAYQQYIKTHGTICTLVLQRFIVAYKQYGTVHLSLRRVNILAELAYKDLHRMQGH